MTSIYLFALVAGTWLLQQQPVLPGLTGAAVLVPLGGLWIVFVRQHGEAAATFAHVLAIIAFATAGFFWAAAVGSWKLADELPEVWEGRDVEIAGVVAEMVQPGERGVRLLFDVERSFTLNAQLPARVSLMWYATDADPVPVLLAGQRWRLHVRLQRPHGNANPAGFDSEAWMLERGIRATGYVRAQPVPRLVTPLVWRPGYLLQRARELARSHLLAALGERPYAGVIVALAIGDQHAIAPEHWRVFTRTGVNHLMSISGLHITMVASLVLAVVSRCWRRSEALLVKLPAVRAGVLFSLATALAYATLSGFAIPAQRTVYMLAVVAVALWSGWATRPTAVLAAAAALVVILDPMAVIAPGFWLSFGAVAVIMFAAGGRIARPGWLRAWARTQWAVTLALVPFLLAMFQQVSLVSPLANAFAIPLVSLVVVPLALAAAVLPVDWIAHAAHAVMALCMLPLQTLGELPDAVWQQHAPAAWAVPIALCGAVWMLLPRGFPARWVGAMGMLPLFLWAPPQLLPGELQLAVLDVGQGLAVVVRTRGHALLYDAGPAFSELSDAGSRIVVPYLRAAGVRRLDGMVVSHDHSDHSGGALSVLQAVPVAWLASPLREGHPLRKAAASSRYCVAGERWDWDEVSFEFRYPQPADYNSDESRDNDRSCVLRIVSRYGSVMLPGDIERRSESRLLLASEDLHADVLLAPHHGSRTSSTPDFVNAVAPVITVFSTGYRNRFGHPHPLISARYRAAGSRTLRTDEEGALIIAMNADGTQVQDWRYTQRRYWIGR